MTSNNLTRMVVQTESEVWESLKSGFNLAEREIAGTKIEYSALRILFQSNGSA